jgi:hypothetical protein
LPSFPHISTSSGHPAWQTKSLKRKPTIQEFLRQFQIQLLTITLFFTTFFTLGLSNFSQNFKKRILEPGLFNSLVYVSPRKYGSLYWPLSKSNYKKSYSKLSGACVGYETKHMVLSFAKLA